MPGNHRNIRNTTDTTHTNTNKHSTRGGGPVPGHVSGQTVQVLGSEDVGDANLGRVAYEIALWVLKALLIFSGLVLAVAILVVVCLVIVRRLVAGPQDST